MSNVLTRIWKEQELLKVLVLSLEKTITKTTLIETKSQPPLFEQSLIAGTTESSASIRLESPELTFELLLEIPQDILLPYYSGATLHSFESCTSLAAELPGELLNIAFNAADPTLRGWGKKFKASFPVIIVGRDLVTVRKALPNLAIVVPFEAMNKVFRLCILEADSLNVQWNFED